MELRGGGWTSVLRVGTARSDTEGTNFLSAGVCEHREIK